MKRLFKKVMAMAMLLALLLPMTVFADGVKPVLETSAQTAKVGDTFDVTLRFDTQDDVFVVAELSYPKDTVEVVDDGSKAFEGNELFQLSNENGVLKYTNVRKDGVKVQFKVLKAGDIELKAKIDEMVLPDLTAVPFDQNPAVVNLKVEGTEPPKTEAKAEEKKDKAPEKKPETPPAEQKEAPAAPKAQDTAQNQSVIQKFFTQVKNDMLLLVLFVAIVLIVLILIILIIESLIKGRKNKRAVKAEESVEADENVRVVRRRPTLEELDEIDPEENRRPARIRELDSDDLRVVPGDDEERPVRRPVRRPAGADGRRPVRRPGDPNRRPVRRPADAEGRRPVRRPADAEGNRPVRRPVDAEGKRPVRRPADPNRRPVRRPADAEGRRPVRRPMDAEGKRPVRRPVDPNRRPMKRPEDAQAKRPLPEKAPSAEQEVNKEE